MATKKEIIDRINLYIRKRMADESSYSNYGRGRNLVDWISQMIHALQACRVAIELKTASDFQNVHDEDIDRIAEANGGEWKQTCRKAMKGEI